VVQIFPTPLVIKCKSNSHLIQYLILHYLGKTEQNLSKENDQLLHGYSSADAQTVLGG